MFSLSPRAMPGLHTDHSLVLGLRMMTEDLRGRGVRSRGLDADADAVAQIVRRGKGQEVVSRKVRYSGHPSSSRNPQGICM